MVGLGPVDDPLVGFKKMSRELHGGADHQQDPNNTFYSLKASMFANLATMEAFRESEVSQFSQK